MIIGKYKLLNRISYLEIPEFSNILHVAYFENQVTLWAEIDFKHTMIRRKFYLYGTGEAIPPGKSYIGTVITDKLVWHIHES